MAEMTYIKVFVDYLDAIEPLEDDERGRLFTALLTYARTGEAVQLEGNERFLFPMMRAQLDRDTLTKEELAAKRSEAAKAAKKNAQVQNEHLQANAALDSTCKQNEHLQANGDIDKDKDKDKEEDKDKDKDKDENNARANDAFDRFWAAYPRKVGKYDAKRSFLKLKGVKTETLIAAIERQKQSLQWQKDNGQYIPNPATWLNQGRWEDVLQTADKGTCQQQTTVDAPQLDYLREVYAKVKGG